MKKIFILERDQEIGEILRFLLSEDYRILLSSSYRTAVQDICKFHPDLLILDSWHHFADCKMLLQTLKHIREFESLPYMISSTESNIGDIAGKLSAVAFLSKPFDINDFLSAIRRILSASAPSCLPLFPATQAIDNYTSLCNQPLN